MTLLPDIDVQTMLLSVYLSIYTLHYTLPTAHQEHQAILERLEESNRALDIEQNKLERMRRDAQARADQDRNTANQLKDELASMKARLEEAK